jgi:hypothetical protein
MATILTGKSPGKTSKAVKSLKSRSGKSSKPDKLRVGIRGQAHSSNDARISTQPKAGTVKGSDGRQHAAGRYRMLVEKK